MGNLYINNQSAGNGTVEDAVKAAITMKSEGKSGKVKFFAAGESTTYDKIVVKNGVVGTRSISIAEAAERAGFTAETCLDGLKREYYELY